MPRKLPGIRRRGDSWEVYVRVNGHLYTKAFPLATRPADMLAWRAHVVGEKCNSITLAAMEARRLPPTVGAWCYIYFAQSGDAVKIGRAVDPCQRVRDLQTAHAGELVLLAAVAGHQSLEGAIHTRFAHLRTRGEWFRLDENLVAFIDLVQRGANPVELLFEDPRVILGWHRQQRPAVPEPLHDATP